MDLSKENLKLLAEEVKSPINEDVTIKGLHKWAIVNYRDCTVTCYEDGGISVTISAERLGTKVRD